MRSAIPLIDSCCVVVAGVLGWRPMRRPEQVAVSWLLAAGTAGALQVRAYDPARHDRFSGFPSSPVENPGFLHVAARFRGLGWWQPEVNRQFALVSPRHFVCATHYQPSVGSQVRFAGVGGMVVTGTVAAVTAVTNGGGVASDLALGTLTAAVDGSTGVTPFPWLNLGPESTYRGASLIVMGKTARGASGTLAGFTQLEGPGLNPSRAFTFIYRNSGLDPDDAKLEIGDSGSPTFVFAAGQPALVGVHSSVSNSGATQTNYDVFIPHYIASLDALLAPAGHRMRPAYLAAVQLATSSAASPATPRQGHPGQVALTVTNLPNATLPSDTGNLAVEVKFPAGTAPDSLAAPDWVVEPSGTDAWKLRRARLAGGTSSTATLTWSALPAIPQLTATVDHVSDASPPARSTLCIDLLPSYAAWADGLTEAEPEDDPDRDGLDNLVEYAFGGDPQAGQLLLDGVHPLGLRIAGQAGTVRVSFPRRTDAELRGLSYLVEWSDPSAAGGWGTAPPPGLVESAEAWDPAVAGFERRVLSWPAGAGPRFCRVRIELDEDG